MQRGMQINNVIYYNWFIFTTPNINLKLSWRNSIICAHRRFFQLKICVFSISKKERCTCGDFQPKIKPNQTKLSNLKIRWQLLQQLKRIRPDRPDNTVSLGCPVAMRVLRQSPCNRSHKLLACFTSHIYIHIFLFCMDHWVRVYMCVCVLVNVPLSGTEIIHI